MQHLTVEQVLRLHARLLGRYGGAPGIRDPGAVNDGNERVSLAATWV